MSEYVLYAQDEAPIYQDKRVIYAKIQNGKNINLSLLIYNTNKQTLSINLYSEKEKKYLDTILTIHKFEYYPIENSITELLILHKIGTSPQKASDIIEYQSLSTIGMMVLVGQTFLTTYNDKNQKDIRAIFKFKVKIPIYIIPNKEKLASLYSLVNYQTEADEKTLKELARLEQLEQSLFELRTNKGSIDLFNKKKQEYDSFLSEIKAQKSLSQDLINDLQEQRSSISYKNAYYLVGFIFAEETRLFLNNGFIKGMNVVLSDSIELRYRFGGKKIPLTKLGIRKILDYNYSLDIRNIKNFSNKLASKKYAVWQESRNVDGLEYWTGLTDIFSYTPPDDANITELFVPKKQQLVFKVKEPNVTKIEETTFSNVLKLNIFTDLVGIQENQPNGLVQIEGTYHAPLFGWQIGRINKYNSTICYLFDHIEANLKLSKIENKLRFLDGNIIKGSSNATFVPNFQLLQYSNLETGFKPSIIKLESFKSEFNLYGHAGIIRTGIRDTIFQITPNDTTKIPRTFNILSFRASIQAHLKVRVTSYTGIDIATEFIRLQLLDSDIKQSGGNFSKQQNTLQDFNIDRNIIFNPQFQIYYLPNRDESQRIYLRGAFFHDLATRSNNYLTIQVGLSSDINKFLNFK